MTTIGEVLKGAEKYYTPLTKATHKLQTLVRNQELVYEIANNIISNISKVLPQVVGDHANRVMDVYEEFNPTRTNPIVFNYYFTLNPQFKGGQFAPFYTKLQEIVHDLNEQNSLNEATLKSNIGIFFNSLKESLRVRLCSFQANTDWKSMICVTSNKVSALQVSLYRCNYGTTCLIITVSRHTFSATQESEITEKTEIGGYNKTPKIY